jgi:hypothetical protein
MGVILDPVPERDEIYDWVAELMEQNHGALFVLEPRIGVEFARDPEDPLAAVVKMHGLPRLAAVRVVPYKQRVWKAPDAIITIDQYRYQDLTEPQQKALIDEALAYLEPDYDKDGQAKSDDRGRPKLLVNEPDYYLAGHVRVLERHGADAIGALAFRKAFDRLPELKQLVMGFLDAPAPTLESPDTTVTVTRTGPGLEPNSVTLTGGQFSAAAGGTDVIRDTFAALLSVGHTESSARAAIDAVPNASRFRSVSDLIDAIYHGSGAARPELVNA